MKTIELSNGRHCLVDSDDHAFLAQWKWKQNNSGYVFRSTYSKTTKKATGFILIHRLINKTPEGLETHHVNENKLDNRKSKLITVTHAMNELLKRPDCRNTSGIRGVRWDRNRNKWIVSIGRKFIGRYKKFKEAANVRKTALELVIKSEDK